MEELDLQEILYSFKKKIGIIIIITMLGAALGFLYSKFLVKPMYKASTTLVLAKSASAGNGATSSDSITQNDITLNQKLISTYGEIVKSRVVARSVINSEKLDMDIDKFISNISVSSKEGTEILEIIVKNDTPELSARLANSLAESFSQKVKEVYNIDNVSIIDEAEIPDEPYNMDTIKNIVMFGLGSFGVVCVIIFLATYFNNTVKNDEELERILGIKVLAVIPKVEN